MEKLTACRNSVAAAGGRPRVVHFGTNDLQGHSKTLCGLLDRGAQFLSVDLADVTCAACLEHPGWENPGW